jgi:hypothetical protein
MPIYGLYVRDIVGPDLIWFSSERRLQSGDYRLNATRDRRADVHVAESIPALVLRVGPLVQELEQADARSLDVPRLAQQRIAADLLEGLIARLNETSDIWVSEPAWLDDLRRWSRAQLVAAAISQESSSCLRLRLTPGGLFAFCCCLLFRSPRPAVPSSLQIPRVREQRWRAFSP